MLRLAVIALLLANAGYYAWSQGLLRPLGYAPQEQSERSTPPPQELVAPGLWGPGAARILGRRGAQGLRPARAARFVL